MNTNPNKPQSNGTTGNNTGRGFWTNVLILAVALLPLGTFATDKGKNEGNNGIAKTDSVYDCSTMTLYNMVEVFEVAKDEKEVELTWKTAQTSGISEYIVQRTGDNGTEILGTIDLLAGVDVYNFADKRPIEGNAVYHLYSRDMNGLTCPLESKSVEFAYPEEIQFSFYPNPVQKNQPLNLDIIAAEEETAVLKVVDNMGRIVMTKNVDFQNAWTTDTMETSSLESGRYTLIVQTKHKSKSFQLIVSQ